MNDKYFLKRSLQTIFLLLLFSSCQTSLLTKKEEENTKKEKKVISLFISDAGALTFSVIPMLDFFQLNQVRFNWVAGTGWGAWIAAMYAKNHNTNEIKWQLFKWHSQNLFKQKIFSNRGKQTLSLKKTIINSFSTTPISASFVCPINNHQGTEIWMSGRRPSLSLLHCLNILPPLFFDLGFRKYSSIFAVEQTFKYLQERGVQHIVWLKAPVNISDHSSSLPSQSFWIELKRHLNSTKRENSQVTTFEPAHGNFSVYDFDKINAIMKTPLKSKFKDQFYQWELALTDGVEKKK